jgi:hypothetical protein
MPRAHHTDLPLLLATKSGQERKVRAAALLQQEINNGLLKTASIDDATPASVKEA